MHDADAPVRIRDMDAAILGNHHHGVPVAFIIDRQQRDRDPLAPPALRGGEASCSAPRKFLDPIHAINAQAF